MPSPQTNSALCGRADMYRDIESFKTYFETLQLDTPTLPLDADCSMRLVTQANAQPPHHGLHTLPELQIDEDGADADNPTLSLIGTLGEGGMGVVRLAKQLPLDRQVAVKTTHAGAGQQASEALLQEAYVTGFLEHPNIIPIYMVGRTAQGAPLIVMKRVEGTSWQDLLPAAGEAAPPADLTRHIEILVQVCNAVRFAHSRDIIHRDIKPANVMIGHFDEVYLLDWGIAASLDARSERLPRLDEVDPLAGTPAYMAPEMTENGGEAIDQRTDVYLLGATLHHILTGTPRHGGGNLLKVMFAAHVSRPHEYPEAVADELAAIANKACHRDKAQRFQTVEQFRDALHEYLQHRESIALSTSADRKREELERVLGQPSPDPADVHDTYGECRFGFQQALRMWPDNELAVDGLQRCLSAMAAYYLDHDNADAARACIAELPHPRPDLSERADELSLHLAAEHEDLKRLKRLERNLDLTTAMSSRSRLALILGAVWTSTSLWAAWRIHAHHVDAATQLEHHMHAGLRNMVVVAVGVFAFRKRILANVANRRLIYMLAATFGAVALMRWVAWYTRMNLVAARSADFIIYMLTIIAVGLVTDLRICLLSLTFLAATFVSIAFPPTQILAGAVANALTFGGLAWLWSPSQMKGKMSV